MSQKAALTRQASQHNVSKQLKKKRDDSIQLWFEIIVLGQQRPGCLILAPKYRAYYPIFKTIKYSHLIKNVNKHLSVIITVASLKSHDHSHHGCLPKARVCFW